MSAALEYIFNRASEEKIAEHLMLCDADFLPPLSTRVDITCYAKKIRSKATSFEAWMGDKLVGLAAMYCNDQENHIAYISSISVLREWTGNGIAGLLMNQCVAYAKTIGMQQISLEVAIDNVSAISLYEKTGFITGEMHEPFVSMSLYLNSGEENEQQA